MLDFDVLLTENRIADRFVRALSEHRLPELFFYWLPLSVKAWLALCDRGDYRNYSRSRALIDAHADRLAADLGRDPLSVVSLGAGQGDKDLVVLRSLREAGTEPRYRPVDSSQSLLELAAGAAAEHGFECRAVKADLTDPEHLAGLRTEDDGTRWLVLLLGNTLGGFDPIEMARRVRDLMRPQDRVLVDGEIFSGAETLAGYDNPVNRRFAFAPLASIGLTDDDGALRFEIAEDDRISGLYLIPKHFEPFRDLEPVVAGTPVHLSRGDRLEMSHSYKYERRTFGALLRDANLEPERELSTDDGRFVLVMARPS